MLKKLFTLFLMTGLIISVSVAGTKEKKRVNASESVVLSHEVAATSATLAKSSPIRQKVTAGPADGIEIGTTDYDYGWNSGSPRSAATFDNGNKVHMTFMERDVTQASPNNRRAQKYAFWDAASPTSLVTAYPRPKATGASGFGGVDVIPAGAGAGIAVMVYHTPNFFAIDGGPGAGTFTESAMPTSLIGTGALDPEIAVSKDGNTLYYSDSYGRTDHQVVKSTDFGQTWFQRDTLIAHYAPGFSQGALDVPVLTAANGDLYMVTTLAGTGAIPPLGNAHADSSDRIGYFKSTNGGVSWTWTTIGKDGDKLVVAAGDTVYILFENFSQVDGVLDGNNNLHVVVNGYCEKPLTDTTASFRFYTLYWKSGAGWKIISNPAAGTHADYDSSYYVYAGNAIGFAYPTIAAGGNSLFALWSQPVFTAGKLDTTGGIVQYQLWYSYSNNNGTSWSAPTLLPNSVGGLFSTAAEQLSISGNTATASFIYLADTARGCNVFGEGASRQVPWVFRTVSFSVTSVGDEVISPNVYRLEQNFPNPFNPTTSIRYTIGKADHVSLKVYNMLGQEVATLVNQTMEAGEHTVNFNASNLASGMYLYKIQSGAFSEVKKMMLLK